MLIPTVGTGNHPFADRVMGAMGGVPDGIEYFAGLRTACNEVTLAANQDKWSTHARSLSDSPGPFTYLSRLLGLMNKRRGSAPMCAKLPQLGRCLVAFGSVEAGCKMQECLVAELACEICKLSAPEHWPLPASFTSSATMSQDADEKQLGVVRFTR